MLDTIKNDILDNDLKKKMTAIMKTTPTYEDEPNKKTTSKMMMTQKIKTMRKKTTPKIKDYHKNKDNTKI